MRVAWFPKSADLTGNPYWTRLQEELESLGVEFETSHNSYWTRRRWLLENRSRIQVLHFHFIQPHYIGAEECASLRRLFKFTTDLLLARLLGYRIVWTMHDLMPTWPKEPQWVERWARFLIAHISHEIIVHCHEAQRLLSEHFGRKSNIHVLNLPSYQEFYPNTVDQTKARKHLGLASDQFVVGFVGGLRENKGLELLIRSFQEWDLDNSALLIVGKDGPPVDYSKSLKHLAGSDSRIQINAHFVPDEQMQYYLHASDIFVFPFQWVLTSSSALLAMAFQKPVIVPRLGCLPELVGEDAGIIYDIDDSMGLLDALRKAKRSDLRVMGLKAKDRADSITWRELASSTKLIYQRLLHNA